MDSLREKIYKKATEANIPIAVHFDLTYRCNLHCIHCYLPEIDRYPSTDYKNKAELTTQEIFNILDQLADCGTLFLNFSGGEIFIRHDFLDILRYARKSRFSVSIMTTGTTGFHEGIADEISDIGVQLVDVSLYSADQEIHESVTGVSGSFDKTVRAIEMLVGRGVKVRLKCPLTKINIKNFDHLIAFAEAHGASWGMGASITPGKDGDKRPTKLRLSDNELKEFYTFIMKLPGGMKGSDELTDPMCESMLDGFPCGAAHSSCYISPYGDVQPCIDISIICGNLREKPLKDIWENSEEMLSVRAIKIRDLLKCIDCPEPTYCHRCMGEAYLEHGSLLRPAESSCKITKIKHIIKEENSNG